MGQESKFETTNKKHERGFNMGQIQFTFYLGCQFSKSISLHFILYKLQHSTSVYLNNNETMSIYLNNNENIVFSY